jgi:hypothetical protein
LVLAFGIIFDVKALKGYFFANDSKDVGCELNVIYF